MSNVLGIPEDLQRWRERLFSVEEPITLTSEEFETYWPYVNNVWHFKDRNPPRKNDGGQTTSYNCRFARSQGRPKDPASPLKTRRSILDGEQQCGAKLRVVQFPDGRREITRFKDTRHSHDLDRADAVSMKSGLTQPRKMENSQVQTTIETPHHCVADYCLIPIGTQSASVSKEVADVARLMKECGLVYSMHSAGTTLEGSWDDVTKVIGQAHALLHANGVVRIHSSIRIGTRTDKEQHFADKIKTVESILADDALPAIGPS